MTNGGGPHGHRKGKLKGGTKAGGARDAKAAGKKVLTAGLVGKPPAGKAGRAGG